MPETVDHRGALFLRMAEGYCSYVPFLDVKAQRDALRTLWLEIAPEVLREMDLIRLEKHETLGEYLEAVE